MAKLKKSVPEVEPDPVEKQEPELDSVKTPKPSVLVRVLMRTKAMGPGVCLAPGHQYDLESKFAADLISGGYATEVATDSQRETR